MHRERGNLRGHVEEDHRGGEGRADSEPPRHVPQLAILTHLGRRPQRFERHPADRAGARLASTNLWMHGTSVERSRRGFGCQSRRVCRRLRVVRACRFVHGLDSRPCGELPGIRRRFCRSQFVASPVCVMGIHDASAVPAIDPPGGPPPRGACVEGIHDATPALPEHHESQAMVQIRDTLDHSREDVSLRRRNCSAEASDAAIAGSVLHSLQTLFAHSRVVKGSAEPDDLARDPITSRPCGHEDFYLMESKRGRGILSMRRRGIAQ